MTSLRIGAACVRLGQIRIVFFKNSNIFFLTLGGLDQQAIDAGISIPPAGREGGKNKQ